MEGLSLVCAAQAISDDFITYLIYTITLYVVSQLDSVFRFYAFTLMLCLDLCFFILHHISSGRPTDQQYVDRVNGSDRAVTYN